MASDWVLIPTKLDVMAVDGVNEVLRSMGEVVERGHQLGYSICNTSDPPRHKVIISKVKNGGWYAQRSRGRIEGQAEAGGA